MPLALEGLPRCEAPSRQTAPRATVSSGARGRSASSRTSTTPQGAVERPERSRSKASSASPQASGPTQCRINALKRSSLLSASRSFRVLTRPASSSSRSQKMPRMSASASGRSPASVDGDTTGAAAPRETSGSLASASRSASRRSRCQRRRSAASAAPAFRSRTSRCANMVCSACSRAPAAWSRAWKATRVSRGVEAPSRALIWIDPQS